MNTKGILTRKGIEDFYGPFLGSSPKVFFDVRDVPQNVHALIPYAEFWGISDDLMREELVALAPEDIKENLKSVIETFDDELDEWLAGPEAAHRAPTDAYVAFSAMRMSVDFI